LQRLTIRTLLLGAAVLDIVFPLTVVWLDAIDDVDPVRRTLSLHALRDGVPWMAIAFLAHAFALEMLAAGLRRLPPRPYASPVLLRLAGGAAAFLAIFPPDPPGQESTTGHLHEALALVAFLGIAAAGLFAANAQRRDPAWRGRWRLQAAFAVGLLVSLATLGLLVLVAQAFAGARGYYGLGERVAMAFIGAWMVTTAVQGSQVPAAEAAVRAVEHGS
jgi:uncharacterized membrane protein YidH (DUF202 family)